MHAGRAGHAAGVLTGGAPEAEQGELGGIEPLPGGHLTDGVRHRFDTHIEKGLRERLDCHLLARAGTYSRGQRRELAGRDACVDAGPAVAPKQRRQRVGPQPAEDHLHVRERKRAAAAVTSRAGVGPR